MDALVVRSGVLPQAHWGALQEMYVSGDEKGWGEMARALCRTNIELWGMLVHDFPPTPHLRVYYEAARRYRSRLMSAGRNSLKSNGIVIRGQTHEMCYGTQARTEMEVPKTLLIQETEPLAVQTMRSCRTTVETGGPNGLLHLMFPTITSQIEMGSGEWWLKSRWASKEPHFLGTGIGGAVTGMHPRRVLMDDPSTVRNSRTREARALHWEWWTKSIKPMLADLAQIDIVHTPYYKGDLPNAILTQDATFYSIKMPSLSRKPRPSDYKAYKDENNVITGVHVTPDGMDLVSLWPCPLGTGRCPRTPAHYEEHGYHNSVEYLLMEYDRDPIGFMSQHMLELVDDANTRIKPEMLRYWSADSSVIGAEAPNGTVVVGLDTTSIVMSVHGWDHAIGKKSHHDLSAVAMAYRTKDNKVFFRNRYGRWNFMEAVRTMESLAETDPIRKPSKIVTEGMSFQQAYEEAAVALSRNIPPVESVRVHVDKDTALVDSGMLSAMVRGEVFIEIEDKETHQQLLSFTPAQTGGHDDIVDAMRIAFAAIRSAVVKKAGILRMRI